MRERIFITRYALSSGILVADAEIAEGSDIAAVRIKHGSHYYHGEGKDWHRTWEDASIRASIMVQKKIDSHSKAIAKLMKMTFTNPEAAP